MSRKAAIHERISLPEFTDYRADWREGRSQGNKWPDRTALVKEIPGMSGTFAEFSEPSAWKDHLFSAEYEKAKGWPRQNP